MCSANHFPLRFTNPVVKSVFRCSKRLGCFDIYLFEKHRFDAVHPTGRSAVTTVPALCKFTQRGQVNSAVCIGPVRVYTEIWCNLHLSRCRYNSSRLFELMIVITCETCGNTSLNVYEALTHCFFLL